MRVMLCGFVTWPGWEWWKVTTRDMLNHCTVIHLRLNFNNECINIWAWVGLKKRRTKAQVHQLAFQSKRIQLFLPVIAFISVRKNIFRSILSFWNKVYQTQIDCLPNVERKIWTAKWQWQRQSHTSKKQQTIENEMKRRKSTERNATQVQTWKSG